MGAHHDPVNTPIVAALSAALNQQGLFLYNHEGLFIVLLLFLLIITVL